MKFRRVRTFLRMYQAPIAILALVLLFAAETMCLLMTEWRLALGIAVLAFAVAALNGRAFILFFKMGDSFRAFKEVQFVRSEARLREALPLAEKLASDHPLRGVVYQDLADLARILGNYTDAESLGFKALEVFEKAYGEEHPDTLDVVLSLARTYLDIARYPQAKALLDRAAQVLASGQGTARQQAVCLAEQGRWWCEQGYYAEAEPIYHRAVEFYQGHREPALGAGVTVRLSYAMLLAKLGRFDEAQAMVQGVQDEVRQGAKEDRKSTRLNSSHIQKSRMPSSA